MFYIPIKLFARETVISKIKRLKKTVVQITIKTLNGGFLNDSNAV